jgi:hypothetical protein
MAGELIEQFTDHEGRVSRFIEQFKNKPDLESLLRTYLAQLQDVEDALFEIILERVLDNAVGVQLDTLGEIVGQSRGALTDPRYRIAIKARIAINLSHSTSPDVIRVLLLLLEEFGEAFRLRDEPPAQLRVEVIDSLQSVDPDLAHALLELADPAGVRLLFQYNIALATDADKFKFADETTGSTGGGGGLGDTVAGGQVGGLASVIGG